MGVTHKIVITRRNVHTLQPIFDLTHRLGVRSFILQPVRTARLPEALARDLAIDEDEFMPHVNELLRRTEGSGAEIKLYGMSRIGAYEGRHVVSETNRVRHAYGKQGRSVHLTLHDGDRIAPARRAPSEAPVHRVTVRLPMNGESASFDCAEDQFVLDAALTSGLSLPFGCRMASCGQCAGRVLEGSVHVDDEQLVLTDEQMAAGFVVLCRSQPRSDAVILTHQEPELGI